MPTSPASLPRASRWLRALILLGAAGQVATAIDGWLSADRALSRIRHEVSVPDHVAFDPQLHLATSLWALPATLAVLVALQRLWVLFGEYAQARVFSVRALGALRSFARWMMAAAVLSPVYTAGLSVLMSWSNGPGHRELDITVATGEYTMLLFGAVVLAISSVMAEAARVAEDHAGFV